MHHSRLSTIVLDCQLDDLEPAIRFWSAALGRKIESADGE